MDGSTQETTDRFLTCRIEQRRCAVNLDDVLEVVPEQPATQVPGSAPWLMGFFPLRGRVVKLVDLGAFVGEITVRQGGQLRSVLIGRYREELYGIIVHELGEVLSLHETPQDAGLPPSDPYSRFVKGASHRDDGSILWVVDFAKLLTLCA